MFMLKGLLEHVAAKLQDFADNNMLQVIELARFLSAWVIHPSGNAPA
jgi:hypothetical protein